MTAPLLACVPAHAQYGTNLIVNGDAESGAGSPTGDVVAVPGWSTTGSFTVVQYGASGGFPDNTSPGPTNRGANFFAGGPSSASSTASQVIDISTDASQVDSGNVTFTLSGYLGGFSSQDDNAVLTADFLGASSTSLGNASIGPVTASDRSNETGLLFRTTDGSIPVGTRSIDLMLQMTRLQGSYNDGYADNLSLVLANNGPGQPSGVPEPATTAGLAMGALGLGALMLRARRITKPAV